MAPKKGQAASLSSYRIHDNSRSVAKSSNYFIHLNLIQLHFNDFLKKIANNLKNLFELFKIKNQAQRCQIIQQLKSFKLILI